MRKWFLVMMMLVAASGSAYAAQGDITVLGADGQVAAAVAGQEIMTVDGAVTRYDIEDVGGAVTSPCSVCGMNNSLAGKGGLEIRHGGLLLDVDRLAAGATFELKSPVAVAAVRGTRFAGYAHHEGGATYVVDHGSVDVSAIGGEARTLGAGEALDVAQDGRITARLASAEEQSVFDGL